MNRTGLLFAGSVVFALTGSAWAQDAQSSSGVAAARNDQLPRVCQTHAATDHQPEPPQAASARMPAQDEAHRKLQDSMQKMHPAMMAAISADDIDVAFMCGMIPHHQGAIDMAKVALQYGRDPQVKEMAQKVIDAQEQEISDMTRWLDAHVR